MQTPLLLTPRLALRPCAASDADALHRLWTTPEVRRFLWDDEVISPEQTAALIADSAASFAEHGFGLWAIEQQGTPIGFCGLRPIEGSAEVEVLYGLAPEQWGQGLATEAAHAVLGYAFHTLGVARLWARTDSPNAASLRVMERLGMHEAPDPAGGSGPAFVLAATDFPPPAQAPPTSPV